MALSSRFQLFFFQGKKIIVSIRHTADHSLSPLPPPPPQAQSLVRVSVLKHGPRHAL